MIKITNPFWKDIFTEWTKFCSQYQVKNNGDILDSCLWYNKQLSDSNLLFPDWVKQGIQVVGDLVNNYGEIYSAKEIEKSYNLKINILNYYTMRSALNHCIKLNKEGHLFTFARPHCPFHIKLMYTPQKGSKIFYKAIQNFKYVNPPKCEAYWNSYTNTPLQYETWSKIYKICFQGISDNSIKWFQYKILFNILGTREYLWRTKIINDNQCSLCGDQPETIKHLFAECEKTVELWTALTQWIKNSINFNIELTNQLKIPGYIVCDRNFWVTNFILLVTRNYIFQCSKKGHQLNIVYLRKEIKTRYLEEENLSKINTTNENFNKNWENWKPVLL